MPFIHAHHLMLQQCTRRHGDTLWAFSSHSLEDENIPILVWQSFEGRDDFNLWCPWRGRSMSRRSFHELHGCLLSQMGNGQSFHTPGCTLMLISQQNVKPHSQFACRNLLKSSCNTFLGGEGVMCIAKI